MGNRVIELPGEVGVADVVYLRRKSTNSCGDIIYLQSIRSGTLKINNNNPEDHRIAISYHENVPRYSKSLAKLLSDKSFDTIVTPPSKREDAIPYVKEIKMKFSNQKDISNRFSREQDACSGTEKCFQFYLKKIFFNPAGIDPISGLLIVDDILGIG